MIKNDQMNEVEGQREKKEEKKGRKRTKIS